MTMEIKAETYWTSTSKACKYVGKVIETIIHISIEILLSESYE